jgi:hypothetical protein
MALWIIPLVILLVVVGAYLAVNRAATQRIADKHGGETEAALGDENEPIPSTHLIADSERPLGDTHEAHDEINPHDIPLDNPARHEAAEQVGGEDAETRGNVESPQG